MTFQIGDRVQIKNLTEMNVKTYHYFIAQV